MEWETPGDWIVTWEVFYSPHTDDESIGMAGLMIRAKDEGRQVLCALVTDNLPSPRGKWLFAHDDLAMQRRYEWRRALDAIGVDKVLEWNIEETVIRDCPLVAEQRIYHLMYGVHLEYMPVRHHTTMGPIDQHYFNNKSSIAHTVCADAAHMLAQSSSAKVSLHAIYVYSKPEEQRRLFPFVELSERELRLKREALDCYRPGTGSIGYGYASVPELIDAACRDPHEYVLEISYGDGNSK